MRRASRTGAPRNAAIILLGCAMLVVSACGSGKPANPAVKLLEREDLVLVSRALSRAQRQVASEVAASRAAWPHVAGGLPVDVAALPGPAVQTASLTAGKLELPVLFQERPSASITGPGSGMAALFRSYALLATRGWQMIAGAVDQIEHGSPQAARFARANVNLYIDTVYDAHFDVAQIGRQLAAAYKKLGGAASFGASLSEAEVDALAVAYSEAGDRLDPHPSVKLGS